MQVEGLLRHMDSLSSTQYALTGGFLLAAITGDSHFMQGDLDIIRVIQEGAVGSPLDDNQGLLSFRMPTSIYALHLNSNLSFVQDYTVNQKHLQVLHVHDMQSYVKSFDLDFCRNYYNLQDGLVINSPESIIYAQCRINLEQAYFQDIVPNDIMAKAEMIEARLAKYRARGYKIQIEPGLSRDDLRTFMEAKRTEDDQKDFASIAHTWNLFWTNKR